MGYLTRNGKSLVASKIFESDLIQALKKHYKSKPQTFDMILRIFTDAAERANANPSVKSNVCFTKVAIEFGHTNLSPSFDVERVWDRVEAAFSDPRGVMQKKCMGTLFIWAMADMCERLDEYWVCWVEEDTGIYDAATGKEVAVNSYFKSPSTRPNLAAMAQKLGAAWGATVKN